jgi:hypothetical protein
VNLGILSLCEPWYSLSLRIPRFLERENTKVHRERKYQGSQRERIPRFTERENTKVYREREYQGSQRERIPRFTDLGILSLCEPWYSLSL